MVKSVGLKAPWRTRGGGDCNHLALTHLRCGGSCRRMLLRKVMMTIPGLTKALKDLLQRRIGPLLLVQRYLDNLQRQCWEGRGFRLTRLCDTAVDRMPVSSVVGWRDWM